MQVGQQFFDEINRQRIVDMALVATKRAMRRVRWPRDEGTVEGEVWNTIAFEALTNEKAKQVLDDPEKSEEDRRNYLYEMACNELRDRGRTVRRRREILRQQTLSTPVEADEGKLEDLLEDPHSEQPSQIIITQEENQSFFERLRNKLPPATLALFNLDMKLGKVPAREASRVLSQHLGVFIADSKVYQLRHEYMVRGQELKGELWREKTSRFLASPSVARAEALECEAISRDELVQAYYVIMLQFNDILQAHLLGWPIVYDGKEQEISRQQVSRILDATDYAARQCGRHYDPGEVNRNLLMLAQQIDFLIFGGLIRGRIRKQPLKWALSYYADLLEPIDFAVECQWPHCTKEFYAAVDRVARRWQRFNAKHNRRHFNFKVRTPRACRIRRGVEFKIRGADFGPVDVLPPMQLTNHGRVLPTRRTALVFFESVANVALPRGRFCFHAGIAVLGHVEAPFSAHRERTVR